MDSNMLNYNYLDSDNIEEPDGEVVYARPSQEIIQELREENNELRNDMKKLYFLTQENKNNLIKHIQLLKEENFKLKNDKKDLEYKLLFHEKENNELKADKERVENESKIMEQRYLNEIKELNCQLNNYKIKLNHLNLDYDQLLNDFHFAKKEKIFRMSEPVYSMPDEKQNNKEAQFNL